MSSLHPDRLPIEEAAPAPGTRAALTAASGKTSRRASGKAPGTTSTRSVRRRGTPTGKPTADAAPATVEAKPAKAKTTPKATAKATPKATPEAAPAEPATPTRVEPSPAALAVVAEPLVADGPALEDLVLPGDPPTARRLFGRRGSAGSRRRSLYLAAALVTVVGVGGGLTSVGPVALAETSTASAPVSVADQLGIPADPAAPIIDDETTDRLGDLVASRAERDAEQTEATRVQAEADAAAAEEERRAAAAAAEAARPDAVLPVPGGRLTSGFGARWGTLHAGIDLAAPMRTPEYAVMDGIVLEAGPASGFGLAVYVQHDNGDVTVYGHMDEILVSAGQVVRAGDTIALLGNTGQSTGPHLHLEVHQGGLDGTKIDPVPWLRERGLDI